MTTYKGLTVEINAETKGLTSALREASKGASATAKELKQVENALKFNPDSARLTTRQMELLADKVEEATKRLKVLKQAEEQIGKSGMSTDQWTKLQAEIATTESKLDNFKRKLSELQVSSAAQNTALGRMGTALTNFGDRYQTLGSTLQNAGQTLTSTVTPALLGIGGAAIVAATNIDTSLTNVRKTVDGTEQQYEQLKDAAIEFSKTNAVSASQILDIQALGAQLGFSIDELQEFGEVVSGLDIATNMDAETAATNLAQFANITRMSHDEISNYASAIVGLGNNFATTESDISNMAMRIASAGTQAGMSQADILGLSTALSSLGMEAEAGGSAISTIITNIDKAVATNSDSLGTWAETAGMSAQQFAEAWKSDPVEALADVLSGMQEATEEGGNMATMLEELGITELRQSDAMRRMAGNADLVSEAVATANSEWEKNTALGTEVENRNDSLAAKFEMLKNRVLAVAEDIGGALADALFAAIDAMEPLFQGIENGAKAFSNMSTQQQAAIIQAVALVAALGPLLNILGTIPSLATGLGTALTTAAKGIQAISSGTGLAAAGLSTLRAGIVGVVAALALLGIGLAVKAWSDYNAHVETVAQATDGLASSTEAMGEAYDEAYRAASTAAEGVGEYSGSVDDAISAVGRMVDENASLASSIESTLGDAGATAGELDAYADTIDRLAGKSGLTAGEVALLEAAVEGVNGICGTSYSVVEGFGGAYEVMADGAKVAKDEILGLVEAMKLQVQLDAAKEAYAEAYSTLADNAKTAAEAEQAYVQAQQKADEAAAKGQKGLGTLGASWQELQGEADRAKTAMDEANSTYDAQAELVRNLEGDLNLLTQAQSEGAGSIAAMVAGNVRLTSTLEAAGRSADDFVGDMAAAGVSAEGFASLSDEQMLALASSYDGTFASISALLEQYGVDVDQAAAQAQIALERMQSSSVWMDQGLRAALANAGMSVESFTTALASAGMSVQSFGALNASQLAYLVQSYDGSTQSIVASMQNLVMQSGLMGSQAGLNWYAGLSANAQLAVGAVSLMTGQTVSQLMQLAGEFGVSGSDAVTAFCNALASGADPASAAAQALGKAAEDGYDPDLVSKTNDETSASSAAAASGDTSGFSAYGDNAEAAYEESFQPEPPTTSGIEAANAAASSADTSGFSAWGQHATDAINQSIESIDIGGVLEPPLQEGTQVAETEGTNTGQAYPQGVSDTVGQTQAAAQAHAEATTAMNSNVASAYGWGSSMGANFASGLNSQVGNVSAAASALAAVAAGPLHHSTPDEGPLRDDDLWGGHLAQNFADGIKAGIPEVAKRSLQLASAVADYIAHSQPDKGPLSVGEWVFGYHTAINYADGLYSGADEVANAAGSVGDAAKDELEDADAEFQAYIDEMIASYRHRGDEMKEISTEIADYMWNVWATMADDDWVRPFTGNVYDSMKVLEAAGYDLDSWNDKLAQAAEEQVEWQRKLEDLEWDTREQEKKKAEASEWDEFDQRSYEEWMRNRQDTLDEYAEWLAEYESLKALESSLSASTAEMEEWADLYKMKDDVISMTDESERLADALWAAGQSGATFSQEFLDYVKDGGPEAVHALEQLASMGKDDLQSFSDSFRDAALAEREAEINMRSLYVNSLKYTDFETQSSRLLDYRETVLDVREAMYSDSGLSHAFEMAGVSAEGFALDLESVKYTMEDFQSYQESWVGAVSNGFSQMTKYEQTSLEEWAENLKLNMAEAQDWSDNLQKVFATLGAGEDVDAFRQAVLEGGFDQWGKVIDEMAGLNEEQMRQYVDLFNEAMKEAQLSGIEAFQALAPGQEIVQSMIDGITAGQPGMNRAMGESMLEANKIVYGSLDEFESAGQGISGSIAGGIIDGIPAIVAAVQQAISAAQHAAVSAGGISGGIIGSAVVKDSGGNMVTLSNARAISDGLASAARMAPRAQAMAAMARQTVNNVSNTRNVTMTFNVTTQPGQKVDVRALAKEMNRMQERAMRARGTY